MNAKIKLPNFDALAEKYRATGAELDAIARECVEEGADFLLGKFQEGLERHRDSGLAVEGLERQAVKLAGNAASVYVGLFFDKKTDKRGFMHALYQEFGSPTFKADPWLRPVVDSSKSELRKIFENVFKRHGYGGVK